jgi:predicted regulator of Ras-like GTPase activity (Roadblock/LC7/MglB family)
MGFKENLTAICTALPETFVVTLMDHDGISVDSVSSHQSDMDLSAYFVEMTGVFTQAVRSAEQMQTGAITELVLKSDRVTAVLRPVGDGYYLALAIPPNGNSGKARYLLRVAAPKLLQDLTA